MTWTRHVIVVSALLLCACTSSKPPVDPLVELADRSEVAHARLAALEETKAQAKVDPSREATNARVYHDVAWSIAEPVPLRIAVLQALIETSDPKAAAEAKDTVKLLLPRERSLEVVRFLCRVAVDKGWTDAIPSIIRSYSRLPSAMGWSGVDLETKRPERAAIQLLSPGKSVEAVVFEVFLRPPDVAATYGMDWAQRFRADAWDLLARLDTDGALRVTMLAELPDEGADELIKDIHRCVRELHAMPLTGDELRWMMSLMDAKKAANAAWWTQAAAAIAAAGPESHKGVLSLRHAEAIRWVSSHHASWLTATRQELLSELKTRLASRMIHERTAEAGRLRVPERLEFWQDRLRWADLLAILAIDDAVREANVLKSIAAQAELDRRDTTTEYGGIIILKSLIPGPARAPDKPRPGAEFVALLFPPRPGQRQGDERFVASDDMVNSSDLALAHYHLHAQKVKNSEYAGPSPGDLVYAARSGRSCIVITPVAEGAVDIDYYQPDGAVIDLGEAAAAAE